MKAKITRTIGIIISIMSVSMVHAATNFSAGSDGSYGALNITSGVVTLNMPADGIFHCTTITISNGATLKFTRNALNTPVYLLATGDILVDGTIDVSGQAGSTGFPGDGGPGGFDGGVPAFDDGTPGAGQGPGAGLGGEAAYNGSSPVGSGSYQSRAASSVDSNDGNTYGSSLLIPIIGSSGGGGTTGNPGKGEGGGGGAILLASDTRIDVNGFILAKGGQGGFNQSTLYWNGGSGGAIRLVAPIVAGSGECDVEDAVGSHAGNGRVRVDAIDRSQLSLSLFNPSGSSSVGGVMMVFPNPLPRLDLIEVAGDPIPEGTAAAQNILLPFGANSNQTVLVQAKDFTGTNLPIRVVLTPESGSPSSYDADIDMSAGNVVRIVILNAQKKIL
ncbi:MAG: hypothetical protein GKR87_08200 [Kiritimatiellae bacterium]|nr:hypothetical protein [Kiritimatiellia bacterium]